MEFITELKELGFNASKGAKSSGHISVLGNSLKMPATFIGGHEEGKHILITGGVHGGEYPCIETAIRLAQQLNPEEVVGDILIIHPVNTTAFLARMQYFVPSDGKNLNRVFPGKAKGTTSEQIAYTVNRLQQCADFYIDLHGGDIHESLVPFVIYSKLGGDDLAEESKRASEWVGFPYVVGSSSVGGSIAGAAQSGVPGFLAELGQCGRWSEEEVDQYMEGIKNVLRSFKVLSGEAHRKEVHQLERMAVVTTENDGCWYPIKNLEDRVSKGEKIGEVRDYFGKTLSEYHAPEDGLVLYLVTSLAITSGDPLFAIGVS